jgi:ribonuclease VapC
VIVVDTSALMAVLLGEPASDACIAALEAEDEILISAGTVAEALIVAGRRRLADELTALIDDLGFDVIPVTDASARRVGQAYEAWGKGSHPAGLNFGDCFAYALAKERDCVLLFVGDDFSRTDIAAASP